MLKNFLVITIAFCVLCCFSDTARACIGEFPTTVKGEFLSADAAFVGKVIEIKTTKRANLEWILKESGTLKLNKTPRLKKYFEEVDSVTFEVIESFKGVSGKIFELFTPLAKNSCFSGISFLKGDSYLVFANKTTPLLSTEELSKPRKNWTLETRISAEIDEFNKPLPSFETDSRSGTVNQRVMEKKVELIRDFLTNGKWAESQEKQFPIKILY